MGKKVSAFSDQGLVISSHLENRMVNTKDKVHKFACDCPNKRYDMHKRLLPWIELLTC